MRHMARVGFAIVVTILLGAHAAHAQGYVAPSLGVTLANDAGKGRANVGADVGWLAPREPLGVELDVVYAPSFFGNAGGPLGDNSVTTVMGNIVLAAGHEGRGPGRRRGPLVRPYVSAGAGVMHEISNGPNGVHIGNTDLGVNLGVGVMAFARRSVGVRGDVRYFRNLVNTPSADTNDIRFGAFHLWRASIGLLLGF